ncbi:MAG: phosphoglycerate dehydrogenase [Gemmatimonadetes bacterium]|nr:MAG: phosphoglycerate dehydrogenase [Gemmatimonadota bacterium]
MPTRGEGEVSERFLIIAADKISASGLDPLTSDDRFEVVFTHDWDEDRFNEALARAHGLIVRSATQVTRELLERAPNLRVVGRAGVGVDNIDIEAATERGIPVMNAPAGNTVSAAELTMALILATARKVAAADRSIREGRWERSRFAGTELRGKTLALMGAGRIGGEVARRAQGFGMRTIAYDPYLTEERAAEIGLERVGFETALARADVLTLHVPLTPQTEGMIGAEELARMKPSAFLINVARGGVVDEGALARALCEGVIAGAALDVFAHEPLEDESPLRHAPNLVLTPHLGASTAEAQELVAEEIAEGVHDALLFGDLSRALNAPAIGGEALRRLRPLLVLARAIGRIAGALVQGGLRSVSVRLAGSEDDALKPVSAKVLEGLLGDIVGRDQVNYVNASHLARARRIGVTTGSGPERPGYNDFLDVMVRAERGSVRVAGALLGDHQHPRLVRIDDYALSVRPEGCILVLRNRDVPGVIGRVGTLLGEHGLNIAEYHQARVNAGGDALAVVRVDGHVPPALLEELRALDDIHSAHAVRVD